MSEIAQLINLRSEVSQFKEDVTEALAELYRKNLNGRYKKRADKGIQVASQAKPENLNDIIKILLKDRDDKGAKTAIEKIPQAESLKRALILALWSCRPVKIDSQDKIRLQSKQVYKDHTYHPPVDLNGFNSTHKTETQNITHAPHEGNTDKNLINTERVARLERLKLAPKLPEKTSVLVEQFKRNPDVVAEVLYRANGVCENCKQPAPFVRSIDGTPYLEVHHRIFLSQGGEDTVANAIALCPNCHRKAHFG